METFSSTVNYMWLMKCHAVEMQAWEWWQHIQNATFPQINNELLTCTSDTW